MIARSIALSLLLAKFAFGLDASQSPDQIAHGNLVETDNQPTSALVTFVHLPEADDTDAGVGVDVAVKRTGLRGFHGGDTNLSAKTGSIDAGERSNRLVGASTRVSRIPVWKCSQPDTQEHQTLTTPSNFRRMLDWMSVAGQEEMQ